MATSTYDQLAQAVGTGSAASIYAPGATENAIIMGIRVVNTTAGALSYKMYHDKNGTTYDSTTQIYPLTSIAANSMVAENDARICMDGAGNLAWNGAVGLTITVYGVVIT